MGLTVITITFNLVFILILIFYFNLGFVKDLVRAHVFSRPVLQALRSPETRFDPTKMHLDPTQICLDPIQLHLILHVSILELRILLDRSPALSALKGLE